MAATRKILISGGGIAGLTLGYWLREAGFRPQIVERHVGPGTSGYMIDFYGSGFDVAEKMGLLKGLQARHYPLEQMRFVDRKGRERAHLELDRFRKALHYRHVNVLRGDLEQALRTQVRDRVPIHFDTRIVNLVPGPDGVEVILSDGSSQVFDLVIGADGIHSTVRRLAWHEDRRSERFLGLYVACGFLENDLGLRNSLYCYLEPGRHVSAYPVPGDRLATLFAFRAERQDLPDLAAKKACLNHHFQGLGWHTPELLAKTLESPEFYFDAVSQIELDQWYQQRIALVGDACQCLTLLAGQGASLAMAGAYVLARELAAAGGDHSIAYPAYQARLKPRIDQRQAQARRLAETLVPPSHLAILRSRLALWVMTLPGAGALARRSIGATSVLD